MIRYAAAGLLLGFALALLVRARRERREAQNRIGQSRSIFEAGIERQTARLRAELDDDQAVARWLAGDPR